MEHNQKGMSLVETLLATMLFSILTLGIWSAFNKVYWSSQRENRQIRLIEELQLVTEFIQEEIRMSEAVIIKTGKGTGSNIMQQSEDISNQILHSISFIEDRDNAAKTEKRMNLDSSGKYEGFYTLVYQGNNLSESIKEVKVSRKKQSNLVELLCIVGDISEELILTTNLLISLEHKQLD